MRHETKTYFSNTQPVATLKDGSTFNDGPRLTTTDALQIQNKYCKMKDDRKSFRVLRNFIIKAEFSEY